MISLSFYLNEINRSNFYLISVNSWVGLLLCNSTTSGLVNLSVLIIISDRSDDVHDYFN